MAKQTHNKSTGLAKIVGLSCCSSILIASIILCSLRVQQVTGAPDAGQAFDSELSDLFKNDSVLVQSIGKYLDGLPKDNEKFNTKAKEALKEAAEEDGDGDNSLVKNLMEVIFKKGKETLAKIECRPCPSCGASPNSTTTTTTTTTSTSTTTAPPSASEASSSPAPVAASTTAPPVATAAPKAPVAPAVAPAMPLAMPAMPALPTLAPLTLPPLPGMAPLTLPPLPQLPGSSRMSLDDILDESTTSTRLPHDGHERSANLKEEEDDEDEDEEPLHRWSHYKHVADEYDDDDDDTNDERRKRSIGVVRRRKRAANDSRPQTNEKLFEETLKLLVDDSSVSDKLLEAFHLLPIELTGVENELAKNILANFSVSRADKQQANATQIVLGYVLDQFRLVRSGCKVCPACPADIGLRAMRSAAPRARGKQPMARARGRAPQMRAPHARAPAVRGRPAGQRPAGQKPVARRPARPGGGGGNRHRSTVGANSGGGGGGGGCGKAPLNPLTPGGSGSSAYIVGGVEAAYGEWPSYVFVTSVTSPGWTSNCGGVLIAPNLVMTAAHCVVDSETEVARHASAFTVRVGEYNIQAHDSAERSYKVTRVCKASSYSGHGATVYDYAVLTVAQDIAYNQHVQPACLPECPVPTSGPGAKCFIPGLGAVGFTDGRQADHTVSATIMQKMRVQQTSCSVWGHAADQGRVCFTNAEGRRADSCRGDSGGPILCLDNSNRWTVVGLVSYGTKDCQGGGYNNFVGVYADVTKLLGTIRNQCGI